MGSLAAVRPWLRRSRRAASKSVSAAIARIPWPELAHSLAILGGWALLTWGVAALTVWQVWPISGGLFLLSLAGWRHLRELFGTGFYTLTRSEKAGGRG